jgi:hypothetical protein
VGSPTGYGRRPYGCPSGESRIGGREDVIRIDPTKGDGGHLLLDLGRAAHARAMRGGAKAHEAGFPVVGLRGRGEVLVSGGGIGEVVKEVPAGPGSDEHVAVFPLIRR